MKQDYVKAVKWHQLAAEAGPSKAQNNLGSMYEEGTGVEQDHAQAPFWYNNRAGVVAVVPENGRAGVKAGRAAVLLDGAVAKQPGCRSS